MSGTDAALHHDEAGSRAAGGFSYLDPAPPVADAGLSDMLALLWRRRMIFAASFAVLLGVALTVIMLLPSAYTASALLVLDPRETHYADLPDVVGTGTSDPELGLDVVRSEIQVLQSPDLAFRVIDALRLQDNPVFLGRSLAGRIAAQRRGMAFGIYEKNLSAYNDGKSFVISMSFTTASPDLARAVLAKHIAFYLADQKAFKQAAIVRAQSWLDGELTRLSGKLHASEAALQTYLDDNGLTRVNGETVMGHQLADITSRLGDAQIDLAQKRARQQALGDGALDTQLLGFTTLSRLREQEATAAQRLAGDRASMGERSPIVQAAERGLADVQQKIAAELARVRQAAANDVTIAQQNVDRLSAEIAAMQRQVNGRAGEELSAASQQQEIDADRKLYDDLLSRSKQVSAQLQIQDADVRMVSAPRDPLAPSFPRRSILAVISACGAAVVAFGAALAADHLMGRPYTLSELQAATGVPGLANVPEFSGRASQALPPPVAARGTQLAASLQTLFNSITYQAAPGVPKVLVFTSALPGDGKTTLASLCASFLAQSGARVLLVDADTRKRSLTRRAGRAAATGLVSLSEGSQGLQASVTAETGLGLDMLYCERAPDNPFSLARRATALRLIEEARRIYDFVVIDTPPLAIVDDPLPFAASADATIVVASRGSVSQLALRGAVARLRLAGAPNIGLVLNRVARRRQAYQPGFESVGAAPGGYFARAA